MRASFGWIADLEAWKETGQTLIARAVELPMLTGLVLLFFGTLVVFSRRLFAAPCNDCGGRRPLLDGQLSAHAGGAADLGAPCGQDTGAVRLCGLASGSTSSAADFTAGVGVGLLAVAYLLRSCA